MGYDRVPTKPREPAAHFSNLAATNQKDDDDDDNQETDRSSANPDGIGHKGRND